MGKVPSEVVIPFLGFADHVGGKDRSFFLLQGLVLLRGANVEPFLACAAKLPPSLGGHYGERL